MRVDELPQAGLCVAENHVVGEENSAGFALDEAPSGPNRVAQAERFLLLQVGDVDLVAQCVDLAQDVEQVALTPLPQVVLQLEGAVEVIDDGAFATARNHDHLLDPAGDGFLNAVLNGRLVDQWQHLLGLRLGHGKKPRPEPGGRKDRLANRRQGH
jgi:hypothetical protein